MTADVKKIQQMAARIRRDIVVMIGGEGQLDHLGGSCSCAILWPHCICTR